MLRRMIIISFRSGFAIFSSKKCLATNVARLYWKDMFESRPTLVSGELISCSKFWLLVNARMKALNSSNGISTNSTGTAYTKSHLSYFSSILLITLIIQVQNRVRAIFPCFYRKTRRIFGDCSTSSFISAVIFSYCYTAA